MSLRQCNLNDDNMSVFFKGATASAADKKGRTKVLTLSLYSNSFGSGGMRSLVPFLQNAYNLASLNVSGNNIGTEGFWWLMKGLDGGSIEKLNLRHCGLANIAVLERCSLSHLQVLYLSNNDTIGGDGCKSIAELLQRGSSRLKKLYVNRCNIGDDGAQMIADALANNSESVLTHLELESNNIVGKGQLALLRLVNNVSSMEATCNSNHMLQLIGLKGNGITVYNEYIEECIQTNQQFNGHILRAGRAKIIKYHLNSHIRTILSGLQGTCDYFMRPYANMDSAILPNVMSLVSKTSGLSDMYRLLLARNSELGFSAYGPAKMVLEENTME